MQNLRRIGCPEATIRDIIVADVHAAFDTLRADYRKAWLSTNWHRGPCSSDVHTWLEGVRSQEKALLTSLLGSMPGELDETKHGFDSHDELPGSLSPKAGDVSFWRTTSSQRFAEILDSDLSSSGIDRFARLSKEMSDSAAALQAILDPEEMTEFKLRYSAAAEELRADTRAIEIGESEFREMFMLRAQEREDLGALVDPSPDQVEEVKRAYASAMQKLLGNDRFLEFMRAQSSDDIALVPAEGQDGSTSAE